ncbi:hypothetical protein GQ53DRAFT_749011, partial [Thozetella sp. PMI_491]
MTLDAIQASPGRTRPPTARCPTSLKLTRSCPPPPRRIGQLAAQPESCAWTSNVGVDLCSLWRCIRADAVDNRGQPIEVFMDTTKQRGHALTLPFLPSLLPRVHAPQRLSLSHIP